MYRSLERSTEDTRDGMFLYSTQASFSWPPVDLAQLLRRAFPRPWITSFEFVKVCGIRFSSGKAVLVSISAAILLLRSWLFIFCLSSNFVEKVVLNESLSAKMMASRVSYFVEFKQVITKLRWSIKDNNN